MGQGGDGEKTECEGGAGADAGRGGTARGVGRPPLVRIRAGAPQTMPASELEHIPRALRAWELTRAGIPYSHQWARCLGCRVTPGPRDVTELTDPVRGSVVQ